MQMRLDIALHCKQQEMVIAYTIILRWAYVEVNHEVTLYVFLLQVNFIFMASITRLMKGLNSSCASVTPAIF